MLQLPILLHSHIIQSFTLPKLQPSPAAQQTQAESRSGVLLGKLIRSSTVHWGDPVSPGFGRELLGGIKETSFGFQIRFIFRFDVSVVMPGLPPTPCLHSLSYSPHSHFKHQSSHSRTLISFVRCTLSCESFHTPGGHHHYYQSKHSPEHCSMPTPICSFFIICTKRKEKEVWQALKGTVWFSEADFESCFW